jgi:glycerol-3-phosphate O-acyltransferase / dihydroxyacetone phosphate acyltransferase
VEVSHWWFELALIPSIQTLENGDMICLFPEGISRYHPKIAPLKTGGVANIFTNV